MPFARSEIRALAEELLADLELSRLPLDALVLKARRLARMADDEEASVWLYHELFGYDSTSELSLKYISATARWIGTERKQAFWGPASQQEAVVEQYRTQIEVIKSFQPSGTYNLLQLTQQQQKLSGLSSALAHHIAILTRIRAMIQSFGWRTLIASRFSETSGDIFRDFQQRVDGILSERAETAFVKLPHIFERLEKGDAEAVSHAMTTCRRIIDAVADALFPPTNERILINNQLLDGGQEKVKNRIRAYIHNSTPSQGRYERMNAMLGKLYERVSAGVHKDVTSDEAKAIVLGTYLLLGEIVTLESNVPNPEAKSGGVTDKQS